jgi:methyl-accepting chemotaxis protein
MRDGDLTANVRLRKHDELKDVADLFNQMLASLRNKVKKEREVLAATADKALPVIEHLRQSGQSADADSLQKIVQEIKSSPPQIRI